MLIHKSYQQANLGKPETVEGKPFSELLRSELDFLRETLEKSFEILLANSKARDERTSEADKDIGKHKNSTLFPSHSFTNAHRNTFQTVLNISGKTEGVNGHRNTYQAATNIIERSQVVPAGMMSNICELTEATETELSISRCKSPTHSIDSVVPVNVPSTVGLLMDLTHIDTHKEEDVDARSAPASERGEEDYQDPTCDDEEHHGCFITLPAWSKISDVKKTLSALSHHSCSEKARFRWGK